jgi:predicted ATPase/DNA-binding CsgD family transcriptional regulator
MAMRTYDSDARLYESLSKRELDVLSLLVQRLTDQEIAERLVVAYTTVKWYNRQIFNKLGVENRRQAIERALALGLFRKDHSNGAPKHNLPAQLSPFIDRVRELSELNALLQEPHTRLLTILAAGGMGKTRLALAAAEHALPQFTDGVFYVPLAPLTSVEQVVPAIADAVGLRFAPDHRSPHTQLLDYFRHKCMLLVLDNFEHLLDGTSLVTDLLQSASALKVITTSRERLNLSGETVFLLGGLPYVEETASENALEYGAAKLFVEVARRITPLSADDYQAEIAQICRAVQGMPLAIELAAAWVRTLSPKEIVEEIQRSLDFLHTTMRDTPERLRSVRAVFEAAWTRLNENERRLFRRLSVFHGGFTRDAAQSVTGASVRTLLALMDKALVWWHPDTGRYDMHELLRQYAAQELELAGEAQTTRDAHCSYFAQWCQQQANALKTPQQLVVLDLLDADLENIREAFGYAIETANPDLLESFADLWFYYEIRGKWLEGEQFFSKAIASLEPDETVALAKLLAGEIVCLERLGHHEKLPERIQRSMSILRRFGAEQGNLLAFWYEGIAASIRGDPARGAAIYREVLEMARQHDDQWAIAAVLHLLGLAAFNMKRIEESRVYLTQSLTLMTSMGNEWGIAYPLTVLGRIALQMHDYEEATRYFEASLVHSRRVRHPNMIDEGLYCLAQVALETGELDTAAEYLEEILVIRRNCGQIGMMIDAYTSLADIANAAGDYQKAKSHLRDALMLAEADVETAWLLYPFLVAAELYMREGAAERTVELVSFFIQHPLHEWISLLDVNKPQILLDRVREHLPPATFDALWERGKTLNPHAMRAELLALL